MRAEVIGLLRAVLFFALAVQGIGCAHQGSGPTGSGSAGGSGSGSGSGGGNTADTSLIGNWQFQAAATGPLPFTSLSGFVNEQQTIGDSTFTTASLQVQSSSCFENAKIIDFEGFINPPLAQLTSFPSESQTITLGLSQQCTGVSVCGTFTIAGGCADKATGTIVGTKYALLKGVFTTAGGSPVGLQMTLNQSDQGTGQGNFQVSGSMAFTGLLCATSASIDPTQSFLSGSSLHLVSILAGGGDTPLKIDATINPAASALTVNDVTFTSSSCFSSLNGASLSNAQ